MLAPIRSWLAGPHRQLRRRAHDSHPRARSDAAGPTAGGETRASIADYALIGDCRSAALVSLDGSIDWLCWPRFDSPAVFAAILDQERGGRFHVRPRGPSWSERRYIPDTNVLETTFHCPDGVLVLRDLMPVGSEEAKRRALTAEHEVLREMECVSGEVELEVVYEPRPGYGLERPILRDQGSLGIWCEAGTGLLVLRSDLPVEVSADGGAGSGMARVSAGGRRYLSLTYSEDAPAVLPPLGSDARERVDSSTAWWKGWSADCGYDGPHREAVVRSALVLKLLTYSPSGAIVAAPTTSLPEKMGGERNWDYRYCWLRDASFTVRALLSLGFNAEAEAFIGWMLHATRLSWPELQVVYNVFGETRLPERELEHLDGFAGSRPVRVGNDAHGQQQLDVYGEVIDAVARLAAADRTIDRDTARLLGELGETVSRRWRDPDEGIWEVRSGRSHHTHSKVLAWVALDRLVTMHERRLVAVDVERFRLERDAIRASVEERGWNEALQSYTGTFGGTELDASLLVLPLHGYVEAGEGRMRSTLSSILEALGDGPLVYRYDSSTDDGLPGDEGAFGICSFWAVECLALAGDLPAAKAAFQRLIECGNDVGLFGEEIDPETFAPLGNFPQAFTHIGLINAALTLAAAAEGDTDVQHEMASQGRSQ